MVCLGIVVEEPELNMAVRLCYRLYDQVIEMALSVRCIAIPADALAPEVPSLQFERPQLS